METIHSLGYARLRGHRESQAFPRRSHDPPPLVVGGPLSGNECQATTTLHSEEPEYLQWGDEGSHTHPLRRAYSRAGAVMQALVQRRMYARVAEVDQALLREGFALEARDRR